MLDAFLAAAGRHGAEVSTGAETRLLDGLDAGAAGIVPGVGNLAPRLAVVLADAAAATALPPSRRSAPSPSSPASTASTPAWHR